MLIALVREQRLNLFGPELAVGRHERDELAAREALGRAALVHVYVRALGADHGVVRARQSGEARDVRARPAEDEEDLDALAELLSKLTHGRLSVGVVAVRDRVALIGRAQSVHHARMDARVVVTRES